MDTALVNYLYFEKEFMLLIWEGALSEVADSCVYSLIWKSLKMGPILGSQRGDEAFSSSVLI